MARRRTLFFPSDVRRNISPLRVNDPHVRGREYPHPHGRDREEPLPHDRDHELHVWKRYYNNKEIMRL